MENQDNFNRDFKGVWIPKEVWLDDRLNALDKIILTEIDSLDQGEDGCFASNEYISNFCQCSATKVSTSINQLIKYGYLYVLKFDGRKRHLKSRLSNFERQDLKNSKADIKNLKDINTSNKPSNNTSKKKESNNTYDEIINSLIQDEDVKDTMYDFIKMRKLIKKPLTDRALKNIINKLFTLSTNKQEQIEILNSSINSNWLSVFPLKKENNYKTGRKEPIPDWMNKKIEKEPMTPEELAEMETLLADFKDNEKVKKGKELVKSDRVQKLIENLKGSDK